MPMIKNETLTRRDLPRSRPRDGREERPETQVPIRAHRPARAVCGLRPYRCSECGAKVT